MWGDKRYYSLNYYLRQKFGCKVFKICLDAGFSCPNRDGTLSSGGCAFCSSRGSGDFAGNRNFSIHDQFQNIKEMMKKKWKKGKYIAYFQAYTNTYAPVSVLRRKYEEALKEDDVVGLAIATRPDCLGEDVLDLIDDFNSRIYTWVELGLQTSNEATAVAINRGYKLDAFERAAQELKKRNIDVVVHIILGLPGENEEDMINTVKYVSSMGVSGVKFHLLHLMKNTPLVNMYNRGKLNFMTEEKYVDLICRAIAVTDKNIVIHRLTGDAPRDTLIEPKWSLKKWEILNSIDKHLLDNGICQGDCVDN